MGFNKNIEKIFSKKKLKKKSQKKTKRNSKNQDSKSKLNSPSSTSHETDGSHKSFHHTLEICDNPEFGSIRKRENTECENEDSTSVRSLLLQYFSSDNEENSPSNQIEDKEELTKNIVLKDVAVDETIRLYCISRGGLQLPINDLPTNLPSANFKGVIIPRTQPLCNVPGLVHRGISVNVNDNYVDVEVDNISINSSIIDFDNVSFDEISWRSRKSSPVPGHIFGFDEFGNELEEKDPPKLNYAFEDEREKEGRILDKLYMYRASRLMNKRMIYVKKQGSGGETYEEYINNVAENIPAKEFPTGPLPVPRVRRVIDEGSYLNFTVVEDDLSRLLRYVWKGKLLKLKKYLNDKSRHSKINRDDGKGRTALHYAASWGCVKTLEELLEIPGIDLNMRDENGKTALFKAVEIKSFNCVKLLIDAGANARIPCRDSRNPLEYALNEYGDEVYDIISYLYIEGKMKNVKKEKYELSYLHKACLAKRRVKSIVNIARMFVDNGEDVNAVEGKGRTPLMLATKTCRPFVCELLLNNHADISIADEDGKDPFLHVHHSNEGYKCFQVLIRYMDRQVYGDHIPLIDHDNEGTIENNEVVEVSMARVYE